MIKNSSLILISFLIIISDYLFILYIDNRFLLLAALVIPFVCLYYIWVFIMMIFKFGQKVTIEVDLNLFELVMFLISVIFTFALLIKNYLV